MKMTIGGDLRPASYRGVRFYVRGDDKALVKAWQVDEYPRADHYRLIGLGQRPRVLKVEAYVADDDDAEARADALEAALMAKGAGWLILPAHAPVEAVYHTGNRAFERRSVGTLIFRMEFIARPDALGAGPGLIEAASGVAAAIAGLGTLADAAGSLLRQSGALPGVAQGLAGVSRFVAIGFDAEQAARLSAMQALPLVADAREALAATTGFTGMAAAALAQSLADAAALDALEALADSESLAA